jgi:hypothetical protein
MTSLYVWVTFFYILVVQSKKMERSKFPAILCTMVAAISVCSTARAQLTITVIPKDQCFNAANTVTAAVTATPAGAVSYSWVVNMSGCSVTFSAPVPQVPSIVASFPCCGSAVISCSAYASGNSFLASTSSVVNIFCLPPVSIPVQTLICLGAQKNLSASGAHTYTWNTGAVSPSITVSPSVATGYTVTGTSTVTGCSASKSITIAVFTPTFQVSPASPVAHCTGGTLHLQASGANSYTWQTPVPSAFPSILVSPTESTVYVVSATSTSNNVNCVSTQTVQVLVGTNPNVGISASSQVICVPGTVTLTGTGAGSYTWSTGQQGQTITQSLSSPGVSNFSVVGSNTAGCKASAAISVTVSLKTSVMATASKTLICQGEPVTLSAGGASLYSWSSGQNSAVITLTPSATNTIFVSDAWGCSDTASVKIEVLPCVGIHREPNDLSSAYPNPADDVLMVRAVRAATFILLDATGKPVMNLEINPGIREVNLHELPAGLYVLLFTENGKTRRTVILKE